jgi:TraM recognition site of TraD and TraG/Type IV secretion-system coupling protein DNA-binding domain
MNATDTPSKHPTFDLRDLPDELIYAAVGLIAAAVFVLHSVLTRHRLLAAAGLALLAGAAHLVMRARAWLLDRRAARLDPPSPGVIVGTVRGDWKLAHPRPFRVPWAAFNQHVLVAGPTGRGKTFTFIEPILRGLCSRRRPTGVFYLDGKGDRVDEDPAINFDFVFCPEDPAASSYWNPLAGPNPVEAASIFASALFPGASEDQANFYEARAVYAITKVAPAMAFTGHGVTAGERPLPEALTIDNDELLRRLLAEGVDQKTAQPLVKRRADRARRQLAWHPYRERPDPASLLAAVEGDFPPPPGTPAQLLGADEYELIPADLNRVLFSDALSQLPEALDQALKLPHHPDHLALLAQLRHDVAAITALEGKERAAIFQSLQNRLGYFLEPPFLTLCSRSDFRIADVTQGTRLGFMLPTGRFPNAARPLGRVALSQFKNAVLSSQPGVNKIAVLDEFHNFVSSDFGAFLNQARSRGGGTVMAMQSLADFPHHARAAMLANVSTSIVTPGSSPEDAEYWADLFGKQLQQRLSYSYDPADRFRGRHHRHVRVDESEEYRYTPTQIREVDKRYALIQLVHGRDPYPAQKVNIERS